MAEAEFEEKQFEFPVTLELAGGGLLYSPGQVLESLVGFDVAMRTSHQIFWNLWGKPTVPAGSIISPSWWGGLGASSTKVPTLQGFELNLFVQWKRPFRLTRSNASQWKHWGQSYYRYEVATPKNQLTALVACANALGQNGLVVYGCPAFHTCQQLFTNTAKGNLVASTNFVEAATLAGHTKYTYTHAGKSGQGHSEPKEIEVIDVLREIRSRLDAVGGSPARGDVDVVQRADRAASAGMERAGWPMPLSRFQERLRPIEDAVVRAVGTTDGENTIRAVGEVDGEAVVRAATRLAAFSWLTGVRWSVGSLA